MSDKIIRQPNKTVWVNSGQADLEYALMEKIGVKRAKSAADADIVFFVGGADVNPALYDEAALQGTRFSEPTDKRDLQGFRIGHDKFKVGICRGGQFLNVMNGGKLWQHVDGHTRYHDLVDSFTGEVVHVSSTHHQQFRPNFKHAVVIATARESTMKFAALQRWKLTNNGTPSDNHFKIDHEVVWYPNTRSLCFQPHPEYTDAKATGEYFESVFWKCMNDAYPHQPADRKE